MCMGYNGLVMITEKTQDRQTNIYLVYTINMIHAINMSGKNSIAVCLPFSLVCNLTYV